ncbi:MAG: ATP-dependent helicase [Marinilabiliales bacterium]|nr:ATP-dependent helicase [Marinilabiliales bacterium]
MKGRVPGQAASRAPQDASRGGPAAASPRARLARFVGRELEVLVEERIERAAEDRDDGRLRSDGPGSRRPEVDGAVIGRLRGRPREPGNAASAPASLRRVARRRPRRPIALGCRARPARSARLPRRAQPGAARGGAATRRGTSSSWPARARARPGSSRPRSPSWSASAASRPSPSWPSPSPTRPPREMRDRAARHRAACARAMIQDLPLLRRLVPAGATPAAAGSTPTSPSTTTTTQATLLHARLPRADRGAERSAALAQAIARAKDYGLAPGLARTCDRRFPERDFRSASTPSTRSGSARTGNVGLRRPHPRCPSASCESDEAIARPRSAQRFRVILVDEYQDSNVAQFELLKRPRRRPAAYVCVVGDDDQSIYRFRGAEVRNILALPRGLPRHRRSCGWSGTTAPTRASSTWPAHVVSRNEGRLGKTLVAEQAGRRQADARPAARPGRGGGLLLPRSPKRDRARAARWSDVAILYRTNAQSLAFETRLPNARASPTASSGSLRFYEREEVKDALAYLALLANPRDEVAFKPRRQQARPRRRGRQPRSRSSRRPRSTATAATWSGGLAAPAPGLKAPRPARGSRPSSPRRLLGAAARPRALGSPRPRGARSSGSLVEARRARSSRSRASLEYHRGQDEVAGTQKAANLDELVNAASRLSRGPRRASSDFLEAIELDRRLPRGPRGDARTRVTLITMHNTKGLEFPVVIVTGLEQGLFPRDDDEGDDLEEQRRLFYVAITRAKDELHLTSCMWRASTAGSSRPALAVPRRDRPDGLAPDREAASARPGRRGAADTGSPVPGRGLRPLGAARGSLAGAAQAPDDASDGRWRAGDRRSTTRTTAPGYVVSQCQVRTPGARGPSSSSSFETGQGSSSFFPRFTNKLEIQRGLSMRSTKRDRPSRAPAAHPPHAAMEALRRGRLADSSDLRLLDGAGASCGAKGRLRGHVEPRTAVDLGLLKAPRLGLRAPRERALEQAFPATSGSSGSSGTRSGPWRPWPGPGNPVRSARPRTRRPGRTAGNPRLPRARNRRAGRSADVLVHPFLRLRRPAAAVRPRPRRPPRAAPALSPPLRFRRPGLFRRRRGRAAIGGRAAVDPAPCGPPGLGGLRGHAVRLSRGPQGP